MASEDEAQALDTHHTDKEWEEQRENFRICYIEDNRTRKDAAEFMKANYNFHATPRQWERKIKQWNFSKYTNRDERLAQIQGAGKTVLDVSRPGRRPRSLIDEYGNLQPHHEDRNLRRFARREVSRSRSRSRSASYVEGPRPNFKTEFSDPSIALHAGFHFNDVGSEMRRTTSGGDGSNLVKMQDVREQSEPLQHAFFQNQQTSAYGSPNIAASVPSQWNQAGPQASPPFDPQGQFDVFSNGPIPIHGPQGIDFQNANQTFPGNATTTAFGYPIQDPSMQPLSAGFDQFNVSANTMAMHPGMMSDAFIADPGMFGSTMPLPQGSDTMDDSGLENNAMIKFTFDDMDSPALGNDSGPALLPNQPVIPVPVSELNLNDNGPLGTDVLPLVERYTRDVQAIALEALTGSPHPGGLSEKVIQELEQPSRSAVSFQRTRPNYFDCRPSFHDQYGHLFRQFCQDSAEIPPKHERYLQQTPSEKRNVGTDDYQWW